MTLTALDPAAGFSRFQSLWRRCLIDGATDTSSVVHQLLADAYQEPQRRYHTLEHIEHCLCMFDLCQSMADDPDALEIAIWFHDVVYVPGKRDNEALSAELYLEMSSGGHGDKMRERVVRLIMATLHDGTSLEDSDSSFMVDIDLSSFALSFQDFLHDSQNLRAENPQLSDADYYQKQSNFQSCLLSRQKFFLSDFFHQRYEQQARDNLSRYFKRIRDPGQKP